MFQKLVSKAKGRDVSGKGTLTYKSQYDTDIYKTEKKIEYTDKEIH